MANSKKKKDFVVLSHARHDDQCEVMKQISKGKFCPFCLKYVREAEKKSEILPTIHAGKHWHVHENRWPYENTRIHLLIIHTKHIEKIFEITESAWKELLKIIVWAEKKYNLEIGAIGMRFGDPKRNGATVDHLHLHITTAKVTDRENPDYKPIRFRMG